MIDEIRLKILNSSVLKNKIENFLKLEDSYKGKDFGDFLFTVKDSITVILNKNNIEYEENRIYSWINSILLNVKDDYLEEYVLYKKFNLDVQWKIDIGYQLDVKFNSKTEEFELRNGSHTFVRLHKNDNRFNYSIWASSDISENLEIFKSESEEKAKELLRNIESLQNSICTAENDLKKELIPFFVENEISSDSEKRIKIKEWLLKNLDENLQSFIEIQKYSYFSKQDSWIRPTFEWLGEEWKYQIRSVK